MAPNPGETCESEDHRDGRSVPVGATAGLDEHGAEQRSDQSSRPSDGGAPGDAAGPHAGGIDVRSESIQKNLNRISEQAVEPKTSEQDEMTASLHWNK